MFRLSPDRKVLITGGASGFGFAAAQRFAEYGAKVALADIDESQLTAAQARLDKGDAVHQVRMNVAEKDSVQRGVAAAEAAMGGIDTLVTSAGVFRFGECLSISEQEWDATIDINLKGTFLVCQAALPALRRSGRGRIVTISSTSGLRGDDFASHYSASKFGVIGLTQSLAVENGRFGVTVNAVCPGTVPTTRMGQSSMRQKIELRKLGENEIVGNDSKSLPTGRLGTADDIADAILFLVTENASWITGQTLIVDGGSLLAGPSHHR